MTLVRWSPWREMVTMQDRMNRVFGDSQTGAGFGDGQLEMTNWHPMVDIYDRGEKIVIKAELPGLEKKDISIDVKDRVLTLKGERAYDNETKDEEYYRRERAYGKFQRSFTLPDGLDPEKINADYKDGLLSVEIPKSEKEKPKQITIH
jgi:HSP20 family protein